MKRHFRRSYFAYLEQVKRRRRRAKGDDNAEVGDGVMVWGEDQMIWGEDQMIWGEAEED